MADIEYLKNVLNPGKEPEKQFFLDLLDADKQQIYENEHVEAVMAMLKAVHLASLRVKIKAALDEKAAIKADPDYNAEKYKRVLELNAEIAALRQKINAFKPFFQEPYFARMDVVDDREGYNSYYIGKHGDERLEIIDWRAPLAQKYYQKSRTSFKINDYDYKLVLRRALRTLNGRVADFRNEYLSLSDYLTKEEIGGKDEELIFDPFLKEILKTRKEKREICDIIETIQEKQFEIITLPERDEFILQGVAGSGKTMILLHRLSYIMYNNESVRSSDIMVITPSDSFNAFIDELSTVLELEKVRTSTLDDYYIALLKSAGVDISSRLDKNAAVPGKYSEYIYSKKLLKDIDKKLASVYDGIYGMFAAEECGDVISAVVGSCTEQYVLYDKIKNASLRVRRCILGEIKEKPDGGLYYTKQFRDLFNCVLDIKEFLGLIKTDERMRGYAWFYRQFLSFYKSVRFVRRAADKICRSAAEDLKQLETTVGKELTDLKRYRQKLLDAEVYTYADGIENREALLKEIKATLEHVEQIRSLFTPLFDFYEVMRGNGYMVSIGKCENTRDILRFFNKEIIRKAKQKYGVPAKPLTRCDLFTLCLILTKLGFNLTPKFSFLFVDEAQDIASAEYAVLKEVNSRAVFNIFGDLKQNITSYRGINDWGELGYKIYELTLNYRNTNEIVEFVAEKVNIGMTSIGFKGDAVESIARRSVTGWLSGKNGLKAVICTEQCLAEFSKKSYNILRNTGKISKTKINLMTVYESKGLEFTAVAVYDADMTDNEKYIAYTRALKNLAIISG